MINLIDDGFSDADIKRIIASRSPDIPSIPHRSPHEFIDATTGGSSSSSPSASLLSTSHFHNWSQYLDPSGTNDSSHLPTSSTKGKAVCRSVGLHMAGHDVSEWEREELAYQLLASLPRSRLAGIQRRILPLLQFDLVGSLPPELSLQILKLLPAIALMSCALVCKRWNSLANDPTLWRNLCLARGWQWRPQAGSPSPRQSVTDASTSTSNATREDRDEDEGMGDEDEGEDEDEGSVDAPEVVHLANEDPDLDSDFMMSMNLSLQDHDFQNVTGQVVSVSSSTAVPISRSISTATTISRTFSQRHAAPKLSRTAAPLTPDYRLLYQTQTLLRNRVRHGAYRLRTLPGAEGGGHAAAVYCLALWSYNSASRPLQVLFTGSKDRTVREWDLSTNKVRRRIVGMHASSVLSLCVTAVVVKPTERTFGSTDEVGEAHRGSEAGLLVSGGSDCRVVVWDIEKFKLVKVLRDHQDSVLCVRTDNGRLVSCSKDRTIRTYAFPSLKPEFVFRAHRAAVNAVAIAGDIVVSGSGDRSVRVWDARTGTLISTFEDYHARAISSVELSPPYILSGSSDRHVRMFDIRTKHGWSTCPEFDNPPAGQPLSSSLTTNEPSDASVPLAVGHGASAFFLHSSLSQSVQQLRHSDHAPENQTRSCSACGCQVAHTGAVRGSERHSHPVRSVALGDEFAVSGSYDCTIKVWDRKTGALAVDLTTGHTGRIFCVGLDSTKIVSCGEDQRICIWDFSHGIDTSFVRL
ncbi:WD40 repeat-like protein [Gyrodon lividus]|nr:WD40 repeat-like protein [Gyrodon lividus]